MQTMNITRNAWLAAGLPLEVPATTVDAQCGSSQQAFTFAHGAVAAGAVETAVACGVELMSQVPMGSTVPKDPSVGKPVNRTYWEHHEFTSQFEGAERMAKKWGVSREDCDRFGEMSQHRAAHGWAEDRFATQLKPINTPDRGEDGTPLGSTRFVNRDEGLRETTLVELAQLKPTGRPDAVHTAGTSSQIADGASAVLLMTRARARDLGVDPLATVIDSCLVGSDPVLMLEGPIPATTKLLADNKLEIRDVDVFEINEAFASVVLAWERALEPDMDRVNPNGGAIALGHPLGATGGILITKAVHELRRTDGEHAIVTMCCGGGLGTGTLLRRG
jgi:acetyl-CoA C-acetyltransferase